MNNKKLQGLVAYFSGHAAETRARKYLEMKGYRFVAQNVKEKRGSGACELDLIMEDKKVLVFIEVKKRKTTELASFSVSSIMQKRLYKGAEVFLAQHQNYQNFDCRFDVVLFDENDNITHLKNVIEE